MVLDKTRTKSDYRTLRAGGQNLIAGQNLGKTWTKPYRPAALPNQICESYDRDYMISFTVYGDDLRIIIIGHTRRHAGGYSVTNP